MKTIEQKLLDKISKEKERQLKIELSGKRDQEPNLKGLSDTLDLYYFAEKLKMYCTYLSYSRIINPGKMNFSALDLSLIPAILEEAERRFSDEPIISIYLNIKSLFENIDITSSEVDILFQQTKSKVASTKLRIAPEERARLYSYLTNFSIRQLNNGQLQYRVPVFDLQIKMIALQFDKKSPKKNHIPAPVLINLVKSAVMLQHDAKAFPITGSEFNSVQQKAFHWIKTFINNYKNYLDEDGKSNALPYCTALLYTEQKEWAAAYELMVDLQNIKGIYLKMSARLLMLKIAFEQNMQNPDLIQEPSYEPESLLESFRGLIRHEKNKRQQQNYQLSFFIQFEKYYRKLLSHYNSFYGKIYNATNDKYRHDREQFLASLNSCTYSYRHWIIEKINSI